MYVIHSGVPSSREDTTGLRGLVCGFIVGSWASWPGEAEWRAVEVEVVMSVNRCMSVFLRVEKERVCEREKCLDIK